jgi:hypothetical protein
LVSTDGSGDIVVWAFVITRGDDYMQTTSCPPLMVGDLASLGGDTAGALLEGDWTSAGYSIGF